MNPVSPAGTLASDEPAVAEPRAAKLRKGLCSPGPRREAELREGPVTLPRVIVPRPDSLEAKRASLSAAGTQQLQLILDFDHTLTRFFTPEGGPAPMCHDVVERSPLMPEAFRQGYFQLWADQKAALTQNDWKWENWWLRSHALMVDHGLRRQWLPEMVRASGLRCRERCRELFEMLRRHGIPVLIVSAGLTEVIRQVLECEGIPLGENVRVLANEMRFDASTGVLQGFSEPVMHSFSKDSVGHRERDYFATIARKHVVLAGDSLADVDCLQNVPGLENDIRVGFFDAEKRWGKQPSYEEVFDVLYSSEGLEPDGSDLCLSPFIELLRSCGVSS